MIKIYWFDILRDFAILWVFTAVAPYAILLCSAANLLEENSLREAMARSKLVAAILGLLIAGCLGKKPKVDRLVHLGVVGGVFWLTNLINIITTQKFTFNLWIKQLPLIALWVAVAGGLSLLFAPPREQDGGTNAEGTSGCDTPPSDKSEAKAEKSC